MTTQTGIRRLSYIQAVNEALRQELERDPSVIIMGGGHRGRRRAGGLSGRLGRAYAAD